MYDFDSSKADLSIGIFDISPFKYINYAPTDQPLSMNLFYDSQEIDNFQKLLDDIDPEAKFFNIKDSRSSDSQ